MEPIADLWAMAVSCEGPGCGMKIPLLRSLWLAKTGKNSIALNPFIDDINKKISFKIIEGARVQDIKEGTAKRSAAICPACGYTTPAKNVREQVKKKHGGTDDAQLIAIRFNDPMTGRRGFRLPIEEDFIAIESAKGELAKRIKTHTGSLSLIPDEEFPYLRSIFNVKLIGIDNWGLLFSPRQALSLSVFVEKLNSLDLIAKNEMQEDLWIAVKTCLALVVDRLADFNSSLCVLNSVGGRGVVHTFGRQALGIVWDFMETNPFNDVGANWKAGLDAFEKNINLGKAIKNIGNTHKGSATEHPLPDNSASLFFTDPPYYDAVPYADLSDYFYVWLKRSIGKIYPEYFSGNLTQKNGEIVQLAERNPKYSFKTREYFETLMEKAMAEGKRILQPNGIGVIVFAHKSTTGWETQLQAMINAGWTISASWPIDTERPGRLRALNSAVLASSIHLVCRPRELVNNLEDSIGDWRNVLSELPKRIHEWMPRLAEEGVVGADAIFPVLVQHLKYFHVIHVLKKQAVRRLI